ncbi:MAG: hypothetical protein AAGG48_04960 [Planctomycetota bacterium]
MLAAATRSSRIFSRLTGLPRKHVNYLGIDIGVDRCKIATFSHAHVGEDPVSSQTPIAWTANWEFGIPVDPSVAPPSNWIDLLVNQLSERLPRCVDGDRNLCNISLPLPWVHYQISSRSDLDLARRQCNEMFENSLLKSAAFLRHWQAGSESDSLVVAATAEQAATRIAQVVADTGYEVKSLLPHGVALIHSANALTQLQPSAIVLLESTGSMVSVVERTACGLTRLLPPCPVPTDRLPSIVELEPWLHEIANETEASFRYASRLRGQLNAEAPVLICGSLAEIHGVDRALANCMTRPIATWRYVGRQRPQTCSDALVIDQNSDAASAVALSLAYAAIDSGDAAMDGKEKA